MPPSPRITFTHHAEERMALRRITRAMIAAAVEAPDRTEPEADGDTKFIRRIEGRQVYVIGRYLPAERKWLVKSTWVRGENDPLLGRLLAWLRKLLRPRR